MQSSLLRVDDLASFSTNPLSMRLLYRSYEGHVHCCHLFQPLLCHKSLMCTQMPLLTCSAKPPYMRLVLSSAHVYMCTRKYMPELAHTCTMKSSYVRLLLSCAHMCMCVHK